MIFCLLYSLFKGFVHEVFSLLSILLASIMATRYCYMGEVYLKGIVESKNIANAIGFTLLFLVTTVLVRLLGMALNTFIKTVGLSIPNRLLGGVLGTIKGSLLVSVLLLMLTAFSKNGAKTISETHGAHYFLPVSEFIADFLPHDLIDEFKMKYNKVRSLIEKGKNKGQYQADQIGEKINKLLEQDKDKLRQIMKDHL